MSTSRDQGAVLYVVSRSGKILGSEERPRTIVSRDYFEGELEGWIFWGSSCSKGKASSYGGDRRQDGFIGGNGTSGFIGNPFDGLGRRISWTTRIPFVEWGDESDSIHDLFSPMDWTKSRLLGRKSTVRGKYEAGWEDADMVLESPLGGCLKPLELFQSQRWYRMEQCYKIGFAQVAILQKSDIGRGWEPGTRELAARWAAWLLKMLRRTRSRPLQHLLFTMLSAVLPVIGCSLAREQWNRVPDQELCRSVDIVWKALQKSHACFTSAQWEILEERLSECRRIQMKLESFTGRSAQGPVPMESLEGCLWREQLKNIMSEPPGKASEGSYKVCSINSRNEQLSNMLLKTEGASALVKRALREKLCTQQSRRVDWKGSHGFSGGPGSIVSLECPISRKRIKVPARGKDCRHLSSFDLHSFLEEHVKKDRHRSYSVHQSKRPKIETGAWCCPICGADATWPQIVVDGVLLRILEVLPEHMPQVCLLPNGRWRMVWSSVGLDLGQNDTKLTTVAIHLPLKSVLKDDIYDLGRSGELRRDSCRAKDHSHNYQQSCGCHELQILHRAYRAWKDGVDHHLSREADEEQSKLQWGANSTIALWTGDHNSSRDTFWQPSPQKLINDREPSSRFIEEITESVNDIKVGLDIAVGDNVVHTVEAETGNCQKIKAGKNNIRTPSTSKMDFDAAQTPEVATIRQGGPLRIGQHKSRPKLMAKKT